MWSYVQKSTSSTPRNFAKSVSLDSLDLAVCPPYIPGLAKVKESTVNGRRRAGSFSGRKADVMASEHSAVQRAYSQFTAGAIGEKTFLEILGFRNIYYVHYIVIMVT